MTDMLVDILRPTLCSTQPRLLFLILPPHHWRIEFYSSDTATPSAAELTKHPFSLSLKGSYSQFRSFLAELENIDRMVVVHTIKLSPVKDKKGESVYTLILSLDSSTYSFSEGPA